VALPKEPAVRRQSASGLDNLVLRRVVGVSILQRAIAWISHLCPSPRNPWLNGGIAPLLGL
jgi:hypothetical protein